MELPELSILESGDLNLKACAVKFLIALLLCYNILFYFNYSNLPVAIYSYYVQLLYSVYS